MITLTVGLLAGAVGLQVLTLVTLWRNRHMTGIADLATLAGTAATLATTATTTATATVAVLSNPPQVAGDSDTAVESYVTQISASLTTIGTALSQIQAAATAASAAAQANAPVEPTSPATGGTPDTPSVPDATSAPIATQG